MSLICPECGCPNESSAESCVECGYPFVEIRYKKENIEKHNEIKNAKQQLEETQAEYDAMSKKVDDSQLAMINDEISDLKEKIFELKRKNDEEKRKLADELDSAQKMREDLQKEYERLKEERLDTSELEAINRDIDAQKGQIEAFHVSKESSLQDNTNAVDSSDTALKCPECGAIVESDDKICKTCGYPLKKDLKKILGLAIVALLCVGIVVGIAVFATNKRDVSSQNQADSSGVVSKEKDKDENNNDKQVVIDFYEAMNQAYHDTSADYGKSNTEVIENTREAIDKFESIDTASFKYADYVNKVKSNAYYATYKSAYLEADLSEYVDSYLVKSTHSRILNDYYKNIVEIELPFEYEGQVKGNATEGNGDYSYVQVKNMLADYMTELAKSGVPIQDYSTYYSYPEGKKSEYNVDGHKIELSFGIDFGDAANYDMNMMMDVYGTNTLPSTISFSNGKMEAVLYSSQINSYDIWDYVMVTPVLYKSDFTENMNANYDIIKAMFNADEDITITIGDDLSFILDDEDKKNGEAYMLFFDVLRGYMEK